METNSTRRLSACFDVPYSLLKGARSCAAVELMTTIRPFVFCNSGTTKLRRWDVSTENHKSTTIRSRPLNKIVCPPNIYFEHVPPFRWVCTCEGLKERAEYGSVRHEDIQATKASHGGGDSFCRLLDVAHIGWEGEHLRGWSLA